MAYQIGYYFFRCSLYQLAIFFLLGTQEGKREFLGSWDAAFSEAIGRMSVTCLSSARSGAGEKRYLRRRLYIIFLFDFLSLTDWAFYDTCATLRWFFKTVTCIYGSFCIRPPIIAVQYRGG